MKETKHDLIPVHEKLSDAEKEKLLSDMKIAFKDLPKILKKDPPIAELNANQGDVIKISRKSSTAGTTVFYRGVIDA